MSSVVTIIREEKLGYNDPKTFFLEVGEKVPYQSLDVCLTKEGDIIATCTENSQKIHLGVGEQTKFGNYLIVHSPHYAAWTSWLNMNPFRELDCQYDYSRKTPGCYPGL